MPKASDLLNFPSMKARAIATYPQYGLNSTLKLTIFLE
jgi:hypothetical protein